MKELFKTLRLAFYVCALPLVVTAVASAQFAVDQQSGVEAPESNITSEVVEGDFANSIRSFTLKADENGTVTGRITSIDANTAMVRGAARTKVLFVQGEEVVADAETSSDGSFSASGLQDGMYSLIAAGPQGFAAHGVFVTSTDNELENIIALESAAVSPRFEVVREIVSSRLPQAAASGLAHDWGTDATILEVGATNGSNRVKLNDGVLNGRVFALHQKRDDEPSYVGTKAYLIQNDEAVQEFDVSQDGTFSVTIEPGVYDFVSVGPEGFAAISFEATEANDSTASSSTAGSVQLVSFAPQDCCPTLDVCMACPEAYPVITEQVDYACDCCEEVVIEEPIVDDFGCAGYGQDLGCGAACGCCGGGGGGFGGGFGGIDLGGIIGAALGAYVLTEVIDQLDNDNDNNVIQQPVVVPPVIIDPVTPDPASPSG